MNVTVNMIQANIPPEIEVLYPMWRYGGDRPGLYKPWKGCRLKNDCIWLWVPHKDLRKGSHTKACQKAKAKYGVYGFRPCKERRFSRTCVPIRRWTGRRYRWYWVETSIPQEATEPEVSE